MVRIWQQKANAEGAASGIDEWIDHFNLGDVAATHRSFSSNCRLHADLDGAVERDRHEDFDIERVDLGDGHDRRLLVGVFATQEISFSDDTVNRAPDRAKLQHLLCAQDLELRDFHVRLRVAQILARDAKIGFDLVQGCSRGGTLGHEAAGSFALLGQKDQPSLPGLNRGVTLGLGFGQFQLRLIHGRFQSGDNLIFANDVAAISQDLLQDPRDGCRKFDLQARFQNTIKSSIFRICTTYECRQQNEDSRSGPARPSNPEGTDITQYFHLV